jgi:hypothetical protein
VQLKSRAAARLPRAYVRCLNESRVLDPDAERARSEGWDYFEIETGHDVMLTEPDRLAHILLGLL